MCTVCCISNYIYCLSRKRIFVILFDIFITVIYINKFFYSFK